MLCKISPIPATSEYWNEVGEEIRNVSVAYGAGEGPFDGASRGSGSERDYKVDDKDVEAGVVRERKVGTDF